MAFSYNSGVLTVNTSNETIANAFSDTFNAAIGDTGTYIDRIAYSNAGGGNDYTIYIVKDNCNFLVDGVDFQIVSTDYEILFTDSTNPNTKVLETVNSGKIIAINSITGTETEYFRHRGIRLMGVPAQHAILSDGITRNWVCALDGTIEMNGCYWETSKLWESMATDSTITASTIIIPNDNQRLGTNAPTIFRAGGTWTNVSIVCKESIHLILDNIQNDSDGISIFNAEVAHGSVSGAVKTFRNFNPIDCTSDIWLYGNSDTTLIDSPKGDAIVGRVRSPGTAFFVSDSRNGGRIRVFLEHNPTVLDANGSPLEDVQFYSVDTNNGNRPSGTTTRNPGSVSLNFGTGDDDTITESTSLNGQFSSPVNLLVNIKYLTNASSEVIQNDSRLPRILKYGKYGYVFNDEILNSASVKPSQEPRGRVNSFVTALTSAAALAVTNPITANEAYDHHEATYPSNLTYSQLVTSPDGVTLTFNCDVTIDSGLSTVVYDWVNAVISYSALTVGTFSTLLMGDNRTLALSQPGAYLTPWSIPATSTVALVPGTYDLAFTFASGSTLSLASGAATVTVASDPGIVTTGGGTITIQTPVVSFTAPNLTSATFNNVRCRLSLVPSSPVQINDDGSVASGGFNFTTSDVSLVDNTISLTGITGKTTTGSFIRFYGSDLPAPIDSRAVYYASSAYNDDNSLSISATPGGAPITLIDVGSGTDMYASIWTELDISLITTGSYEVDLTAAAVAAGVTLADNDILTLQAIHHDPPGTGATTVFSNYLEEAYQFQAGQSIASLSSLSLATNPLALLAEIGLDGSQVTGYTFDAGAPAKVQIDSTKAIIDTRELVVYYYFVQWLEVGLRLVRGNVDVRNLNSIAIRGELSFDAKTRSVMSGPFTYRLDGKNIVAPESHQISFNWEDTRAAIVTQEVSIDLPADVLAMLESTLYLASQIPSISAGSGLTPQQTRDAMKLAPSAGPPAADSIDAELDTLLSSGGGSSASDIFNYFIADGRADNFKAVGFSTHTADDVWAVATRTLSTDAYNAIVASVWNAATRELTSVTPAQITAISTGVEAAIINEGDGQQVIDAILQVFNNNLDLPTLELTAIAQAVRSELTTELGRMDVNISSRLADTDYTAPLDSTTTETSVQSALTAQGYTSARATFLDKLNVTGSLANTDNASLFQASGFSTHSASDVWTVVTRTLTAIDKTGYSLTSAERSNIAASVEAAIINEGDGQQVVDAILQVFNSNLDLPAIELTAIAQAVRSELTTELGRIDVPVSSVTTDLSLVALETTSQAVLARVNLLPSLANMEASSQLTAIADLSGVNSSLTTIQTALDGVARDARAAKNLSAAGL